MDPILDQDFPQTNKSDTITYGQVWRRVVAYGIDSIILVAPNIVVPYLFDIGLFPFPFNYWFWTAFTIALLYRPFFEYSYNATPGKMITGIIVVNREFSKPNLLEILLRNIFKIVFPIIVLIISLTGIKIPELTLPFLSMKTLWLRSIGYIGITTYLISLIDVAFLITDKKRRSLHDRIGKTYVILKKRH